MKQHAGQSDWERVKIMIDSGVPIPFDAEDRAEGLYDPNEEAEVEDFFRMAEVTFPMAKTNGTIRATVTEHIPGEEAGPALEPRGALGRNEPAIKDLRGGNREKHGND